MRTVRQVKQKHWRRLNVGFPHALAWTVRCAVWVWAWQPLVRCAVWVWAWQPLTVSHPFPSQAPCSSLWAGLVVSHAPVFGVVFLWRSLPFQGREACQSCVWGTAKPRGVRLWCLEVRFSTQCYSFLSSENNVQLWDWVPHDTLVEELFGIKQPYL